MSHSTLKTLLAAAILATSSAPAVFAADHETVSTAVRYGDLNLASQDGAKTMLQRIQSAARRVCDQPSFPGDAYGWRGDCIAKAISGAVIHLGSPAVTAEYRGGQSDRTELAQNGSH
jgi:UrcA family protein